MQAIAQNSIVFCNAGLHSPQHSRGNNYVTCHIPQRHETASSSAAQLGSNNGHIFCYPVNATLYFVYPDALQTEGAGEYAAACFEVTPQAWSLCPVRLQRVLVCEDVCYSIGRPSGTPNMILATAFLPNCTPQSPVARVYPPLFRYREAMINTFCHKPDHEQGLRHEFPVQMEKDDPSVSWRFPDPEPVMNYNNHSLEIADHEPDILPTNTPHTYNANSVQGFTIAAVPPTPEPHWI